MNANNIFCFDSQRQALEVLGVIARLPYSGGKRCYRIEAFDDVPNAAGKQKQYYTLVFLPEQFKKHNPELLKPGMTVQELNAFVRGYVRGIESTKRKSPIVVRKAA